MLDAILKVGDTVTIFNHNEFRGLAPYKITTVKRTMKRFVELEDGSKWGLDGYSYPHSSGYWGPYIRLTTDEHRAKMQFNVLARKIHYWFSDTNLNKCSLEELQRIHAALPVIGKV
jgi:hypothetical protein